jgi:hypothetical protein
MLEFIGTTFPDHFQWGIWERNLINSLKEQIDHKFPNSINVLINTTWFGPQFLQFGEYQKLELIHQKYPQIDNLFFLASVDPPTIAGQEHIDIKEKLNAANLYLLGNYDSNYRFEFIPVVTQHFFQQYSESELNLVDPKYVYINYNRKPRKHRVMFVNKLLQQGLDKVGIITQGKEVEGVIYSGGEPIPFLTLNETPDDYAKDSNWNQGTDHGIPHNIHSLGNMDLWRNHFLHVVGETICEQHKDTLITEKTWKAIIGMRPFVINGQQKAYSYLRSQGFRTFNHYWPQFDIEEGPLHDTLLELIKYLSELPKLKLLEIYDSMREDLLFNKKRFFDYVQEQQYKMEHVFEHNKIILQTY